jgi:tRNA threonylcarbamoyladenosine biosynthesis protein TsaE
MRTVEYHSKSHDETIELGRTIGSQLRGGEVVALMGPLGSGKTHIIKGIAAGLGARSTSVVTSPTFVLVNEYEGGKFAIYHIDAYRLERLRDFEMLGFDDFCHPGAVVMIEWADKVLPVLKDIEHLTITLSYGEGENRTIQLADLPEYIRIQQA